MLGEMIGAGINAGTRIIGGIMDANERENEGARQDHNAAENRKMQEMFAREGIRWKVRDAELAGIHPLYALGAQTHSFSPVSIGSPGSSNWSETLGGMGQDISRAVNATRTQGERDDAFTTSVKALELEGKKLDNDIKRASLASSVQRLKQTANPPLPTTADKWEDIPRMTMGGGEFKGDPSYVNTEQMTDRYGESADWWYGPQVMWADYKHTTGWKSPKWMPNLRPGSMLHRWFGDSFNDRFGKWKGR